MYVGCWQGRARPDHQLASSWGRHTVLDRSLKGDADMGTYAWVQVPGCLAGHLCLGASAKGPFSAEKMSQCT